MDDDGDDDDDDDCSRSFLMEWMTTTRHDAERVFEYVVFTPEREIIKRYGYTYHNNKNNKDNTAQ